MIGKHKVAKHFLREVIDSTFTYRRDEGKISTEAALDGIYVIRTSVTDETLNSAETVTAYNNLKYVEQVFHIIKADDLDLRLIHHYLDKRVRAHVLICMLAAYLTWHLHEALAELTFTDQQSPIATIPSPPHNSHCRPKPKTPLNTPPMDYRFTATKTCSDTSPPSTVKSSISVGSESRRSPHRYPSSAASSNYSAPPSPRPASGQQQPEHPTPTDSVRPAQRPATAIKIK